ncbi:hypothetical protein D3C85_1650180 [compost metagenome]
MDPRLNILDGFYPLDLSNRLFHQLKLIGIKAVGKVMRRFAENLPGRLADQ